MFCRKFQTPDTEIDKRILKYLISMTIFIIVKSMLLYFKITLYTLQLRQTYIIQFRDHRVSTIIINDKHQCCHDIAEILFKVAFNTIILLQIDDIIISKQILP